MSRRRASDAWAYGALDGVQPGGDDHAGDSDIGVHGLMNEAPGLGLVRWQVGVPDESRAAMGMALLFSGEAAAAEASIGWLLAFCRRDKSPTSTISEQVPCALRQLNSRLGRRTLSYSVHLRGSSLSLARTTSAIHARPRTIGGISHKRLRSYYLSMTYVKHESISLKLHSELTEKWVQDLIANDPSIIGLGDLVLRDKGRVQPRAGRLDLLLQDRDSKRRYEMEIQLGATDETHIIRTIEYWDIERKRYPQYEHCAVLVAEDITSRFLNVISLFNGTIPLIAIQMQALTIRSNIILVFTKAMDEMSRGLVDEDEDAEAAPTDRAFWEDRSTKATVQLADQLLDLARECDPCLEMKYNKYYIGLSKDGQPYNFIIFRPRKNGINIELKLTRTDETDKFIDEAGFETLEYSTRFGTYHLSLRKDDITKKRDQLIEAAYKSRISH
jgi:hypothetical protein